jgi:hypothetical protein
MSQRGNGSSAAMTKPSHRLTLAEIAAITIAAIAIASCKTLSAAAHACSEMELRIHLASALLAANQI